MSPETKTNLSNELQRAIALHQRGEWDAAADIYDRILAISPQADALHLRGLIEHHRGHSAAALPYIQQALEMQPQSAILWNNLGAVLQAIGKLPEAEEHFRRAARQAPGFADAWKNLGLLLLSSGRAEEAVDIWQRLLELDPKNTDTHHHLGVALERSGQWARAEQTYLAALRESPEDFRLQNDLGSVLQRQGKMGAAEKIFRSLTLKYPQRAAGWSNLGAVLLQTQKYPEAEAALRQALAIRPQFAGAHFNLGNLLKQLGRLDSAIEHYRIAVALQPHHPDFLMNLAAALNCRGEFSEAAALCREIIRHHPLHTLAYYTLFTFNAEQVTEDEATRLGELLEHSQLTTEERVSAYFSLGKHYDRLGQYDRAFEYYRLGNQRARTTREFRQDRVPRLIDLIKENFTPELMERWRDHGSTSRQPIFILGMPRSGSTLVDQILTSHSQVGGAGEFEGMRMLVQTMLDIPFRSSPDALDEFAYPRSMRHLDRSLIDRMVAEYLQRLHRVAGNTPFLTDKMPNNFLHIGLIHLLFPRATILYTRRNPLDVCLSCYFQNFSIGNAFSFDLRDTARYYREQERLMEHWFSLLPGRIHVVDYEQLVLNQEAETHRLIEDICGLPWEPGCLDFHENRRAVHTASLWQVRQPLYRDSIDKWRHYAAHLSPLFEELQLADSSAA